MITVSNTTNFLKKRDISYMPIILIAALFFVLLLMRDTYSIGVNKYLFLAITGIAVVCLKTNHLIYLFCFLFPLYVGLPGNYMTILFIVRLALCTSKFKTSSLIISILLAIYTLIHNFLMDSTGTVPMMFICGIILILMIFTQKSNLKKTPMVIMYSAGVAALGLIMLLSTLQVHNLKDLLSSTFRLGTSGTSYVDNGIMNVSVDPNFYGMFAIASISLSFPLLFNHKVKNIFKIFMIGFALIQLIVSLIGLSRAFILVFLIWIILYFIFQNSIKRSIVFLIIAIVLTIMLVNFMPNIIETILERFNNSDMATANGRTELINKFFNKWLENAGTMILGVGLFNCNVHCMPLQFLFGGGLIMFFLICALFISYMPKFNFKLKKHDVLDLLPFIVTFLAMCTIPAAALINCMFPIVLVGLCSKNKNELN